MCNHLSGVLHNLNYKKEENTLRINLYIDDNIQANKIIKALNFKI